MSSDNQYTALGPAEIGFQTNSNSLTVGAQVAGNSTGLIATGFSDGVLGQTTNGSGGANGVHGVNTSSGNGAGVYGEAGFGGPNVSVGIGVVGRAGVGVYGMAVDPNSPSGLPPVRVGDGGVVGDGQTIGVQGRSGPGTGVFGSGVIGVRGGTTLTPTKALDGKMPSDVGVWGTSIDPFHLADSGEGILGEGVNGVHGRSRSKTDSGVWGENIGGGFGVSGSTSAGTGARGVVAGVWGSNSANGAGVRGSCTDGTGVLGEGAIGVSGQGGVGVMGKTSIAGRFVPTFGVWGEHSAGGNGVFGSASGGPGCTGVYGFGEYGGVFDGSLAPIRLMPSKNAGAPTSGQHFAGELYVDSTGSLFFCQANGTPGTWKHVQLV